MGIWGEHSCKLWHEALDSYSNVIMRQDDERLVALDTWYHTTLRDAIAGRDEPYILHQELEGIAGWKMRRGVWRERNRRLVSSNSADLVIELSRKAFAEVPDPRKPISTLSNLAGVGPATASAVMAAYAPGIYPFFDEVVAEQVPGLGEVAFTAKYYTIYADAIRMRASELGKLCSHNAWTAHDVDRALWAVGAATKTALA